MAHKLLDTNDLFSYLRKSENGRYFVPSEIFHENSKLYPSSTKWFSNVVKVNSSYTYQTTSRPFRHFFGYPFISLPKRYSQTSLKFEQVIMRRRSAYDMSGAPVNLRDLSKILHLGNGISRVPNKIFAGRTTPSAGALYPIELYCFVMGVNQLYPGIYFYDVYHHALIQLRAGNFSNELVEIMPALRETIWKASLCIVIASVMPRIKFKYAERGYRFALIEAGHIAQNILLAATSENLAALPVGGFYDDMFNGILQLDGVDEFAVYSILVGKASTRVG